MGEAGVRVVLHDASKVDTREVTVTNEQSISNALQPLFDDVNVDKENGEYSFIAQLSGANASIDMFKEFSDVLEDELPNASNFAIGYSEGTANETVVYLMIVQK